MAHEHVPANPPSAAHAVAHGHAAAEHEHPTAKTYMIVFAILTVITIIEVAAYYVPGLPDSRIFVPALLIMSAAKFAIVVMFYMHLKYDHKLFRALFTGPLLIALATILALLLLFGQIGSRLRG
jgi:cytochrome c oxidase subunit 4